MKFFNIKNKNTRERLKVIHIIVTEKNTYYVYQTETISYDSINVEICKNNKIILEKEVHDESFGWQTGASFTRVVLGCLRLLREYIKNNNENIIIDKKTNNEL